MHDELFGLHPSSGKLPVRFPPLSYISQPPDITLSFNFPVDSESTPSCDYHTPRPEDWTTVSPCYHTCPCPESSGKGPPHSYYSSQSEAFKHPKSSHYYTFLLSGSIARPSTSSLRYLSSSVKNSKTSSLYYHSTSPCPESSQTKPPKSSHLYTHPLVTGSETSPLSSYFPYPEISKTETSTPLHASYTLPAPVCFLSRELHTNFPVHCIFPFVTIFYSFIPLRLPFMWRARRRVQSLQFVLILQFEGSSYRSKANSNSTSAPAEQHSLHN